MLLGKAKRNGTLDVLLSEVARARLVILDELGCVSLEVDGVRLPCQVISESIRRMSAIFTFNL
ncbi:MAG: ATP-binding protein [Olsenella sp.]|nr:ATP-binding protein [Olsenella sp.]